MRILIVAATPPEIEKLNSDLRFSMMDCDQGTHIAPEKKAVYNKLKISVLITGAGMVATAFALGKHLATHNYDLAINLGICGSFDREIRLGEVVEIIEDTFAELGAEDGESFVPISQLGFGEEKFESTFSMPAGLGIKAATAITVNTVHGDKTSIAKISSRLNPQLESMEGAAFFYACRQMNLPCLQIRAVSNYVEKRNREAWQIGLAIKNLNNFAEELLKRLI
ncbi:futalosine hydrolase [Mucilaginibacter hurinus]|uniref:Futalosine hydrolase n=1 Tax=Mucilaginibacter hurinus TaxID=2201324 RepID=A0A367GM00_9SPHI|nr:futalosine hydrolase [Mucilaginibacter hurinus]RCH54489.1 futalosine hydrolase [Mucilaginibacter hurinus]